MTNEDLPEKPTGWTKKLAMHLNFGTKGGLATYHVFNPEGKQTNILWQYDSRKNGLTGFYTLLIDGVLSWAELRFKLKQLKEPTTSQFSASRKTVRCFVKYCAI